jgi:hypothetical protein
MLKYNKEMILAMGFEEVSYIENAIITINFLLGGGYNEIVVEHNAGVSVWSPLSTETSFWDCRLFSYDVKKYVYDMIKIISSEYVQLAVFERG